MAAADIISHINVDEKGVAWIDATKVKVIEVASDYLAYGWTPEEMHLHQPHLSVAQIYAAMAYYYDHQNGLDGQIKQQLKEVDSLREQFEDSELQLKLRRAKQQA